MKHYNKREKTANLLFKIIEYGLITFGINALLPGNPLGIKIVLLGLGILASVFILALIITPEKENKK